MYAASAEGDKALAAYGVHKKCDIEQPASFEGAGVQQGGAEALCALCPRLHP